MIKRLKENEINCFDLAGNPSLYQGLLVVKHNNYYCFTEIQSHDTVELKLVCKKEQYEEIINNKKCYKVSKELYKKIANGLSRYWDIDEEFPIMTYTVYMPKSNLF